MTTGYQSIFSLGVSTVGDGQILFIFRSWDFYFLFFIFLPFPFSVFLIYFFYATSWCRGWTLQYIRTLIHWRVSGKKKLIEIPIQQGIVQCWTITCKVTSKHIQLISPQLQYSLKSVSSTVLGDIHAQKDAGR
jgi:hypothetical protein